MEAELRTEQENMNNLLDSIMLPFQAKVQAYYQNQGSMSTADRQAKEQELQREQQQLQQSQQQIELILQQQSQQSAEILTSKVDSIVEAYAITNKFQLIIATPGNSTVMYGEDQMNLTETIIDILNAEFEENAK